MTDNQIIWDLNRFASFKRAYYRAVELQVDVFIFEGNEYVPAYAKYLIQYFEEKLSQ